MNTEEELLITVKAIGVNHADLLQAQGKYPPPPGVTDVLGLEVAGIAEDGQRVMCLLPGGGYSEKVTVKKSHAMPIPEGLSFEEAAAIPEVFLTAYQALFLIGELQPEQTVLVHAAGGGVGTAALQLIREAGAEAIATTRSQDKLDKLLDLGAKAVINTKSGSFAKKVLEATEDHGADLILDFVGAPYFEENSQCLAQGGALIFLSTLGGHKVENFDLRKLMQKWATLSGTTLRSRPDSYKTKLIEEFSRFALERFEKKRLKPIIHEVMPWTQASEAHAKLGKSEVFGKIVLTVP